MNEFWEQILGSSVLAQAQLNWRNQNWTGAILQSDRRTPHSLESDLKLEI